MELMYCLSYPSNEGNLQLLKVELTFHQGVEALQLNLPAWRPGRYELQHYARNIYRVHAKDQQGARLEIKKTSKNTWSVQGNSPGLVTVNYEYHCAQMDAGGSWMDDQQCYVNPINCLLYPEGQEKLPCILDLDLPPNWQVATGLPMREGRYQAQDFLHLADSPFMASADLQHLCYEIEGIKFYLWFNTNTALPPYQSQILEDFKKFTETQLQMMGRFPEQDYHFLLQVLPFAHYHGVEHRNSTVITIGPAEKVFGGELYKEFLGISSHELFHAWNICKIRPAELLPYRLQEENYFETGFVAEGFTTYYGDLFLVRSRVFSLTDYLEELNTTIKRHCNSKGYLHYSLAESSFDLWTDGYISGSPNRKSSIYVEGCLAALLLDLEIRSKSKSKKSLDDVMRVLWTESQAGMGYTTKDVMRICKKECGVSVEEHFDTFILGHAAYLPKLREMLSYAGLELIEFETDELWRHAYGFSGQVQDGSLLIQTIEQGSPAASVLMLGDVLKLVNGWPAMSFLTALAPKLEPVLTAHIDRKGRSLVVDIRPELSGARFMLQYKVVIAKEFSAEQQQFRALWLHHD